MKKGIKRIVSIIMLLILFLTQTSVITIAEYVGDEIVNLGVVIKIVAEKEIEKTGEIHNVTIKSSYSNPNDEKYEKVRLYLWEYNEDFFDESKKENLVKVPNKIVEVLNLENGQMIFSLLDNKDLTVVVNLVETETERYLEFDMPPGTSCNMEMEFKVSNGINGNVGLVLEPVIINDGADGATNNHLDDPKSIFWESEFGWENLQKNVNYENLDISTNNSLSNDLTYTFSAQSNNLQEKGIIWTKSIIFKDEINLPDCIVTDNLTVETVDNKFTGKIKDSDNNEVFKFSINGEYEYSINNLKIENGKIILEAQIENPNKDENGVLTAEFNPLNDITINLNSSKLKLAEDFIANGTEEITNKVNCTFIPYVTDNNIVLEASTNSIFSEDVFGYDINKVADKTTAIYDDQINYTVSIKNNGRKPITKEFFDILSDGIYLNESTTEELKSKGFEVGHVDIIHEDKTINNANVVFSKDSDWYRDESNKLDVNYEVRKNISFHSGARLAFDILVPKTSTVNGNIIALAGFSLGDAWEYKNNSVTVNFENAKVNGENKVVTAVLDIPEECFTYDILQNVNIQIFGSYSDYNGTMSVGNLRIYDGMIETTSNEVIGYENTNSDLKTENVSFDSSNWWDGEKFSYQVSLDGKTNELGEETTVTFDLSIDDKAFSGNLVALAAVQTKEDWSGWIQGQVEFKYSDFKLVGNKKVVNVSVLIPETIADETILQNLIINIVGSGCGYSGNITIGNIKLYSGKNVYNNYLRKSITVAGRSTETISYKGTVNTMSEMKSGNIAFLGSSNGYIYSNTNLNIKETTLEEVNGQQTIFLNKYIEGRVNGTAKGYPILKRTDTGITEDSLNVLGAGDTLFYTVELTNNSYKEKEVELQDYNPLAGCYNFHNNTYIDYLSRSYNVKDFYLSEDYYLKMYGVDNIPSNSYNGPVYDDFVDNVSDINNNGKIYSFKVKIPANTTYKQTFVLRCPSDHGKKIPFTSDYEKWEAMLRQVVTRGGAYSSSVPYDYVWNVGNTPANTIIVKDTNIGAIVYHSLRRSYQINKFVLGEELYKNEIDGSSSEQRNQLLEVDLHANYYLKDVYNITGSRDQYVLYGVSIINDSSEALNMADTTVIDTLPSNLEFIEMAQIYSTSYNGVEIEEEGKGIRFYPSDHSSYKRTDASNGSKLIEIRDRDNPWGEDTGYKIFSEAKRDSLGVRDYVVNDNKVEFLFDKEYFLRPYSYTTFYYICRVKTSNSNTSTGISSSIEWDFSKSRNKYKDNFGVSEFVVQFARSPINQPQNSQPLMGSCTLDGLKLSSTVKQYINSDVKANMYKAVVGKNSYKDMIGEGGKKAKLNYYSEDLNKFKLIDDEVLTFCIAVANDSVDYYNGYSYSGNSGGYSKSFTICDNLPKGLEFLGVNTITDDYEIYSGDVDYINYQFGERVHNIEEEHKTGTNGIVGMQEHYLSNLITSGSVSGAILGGSNRKHESLITTDRDYTSQGEGMKSSGSYTFSTSGSYTSGQQITFHLTQDSRSVSYIIYSCRVHPEYFTENQKVRNNASLNFNNGSIIYWNGMKFNSFYNSDLSSIRTNEEGQNVCKGFRDQPSYTDYRYSLIRAYCELTPIKPDKSAKIEKNVFATYDKDNKQKGEAYYENLEHNSIAKTSDGELLSDLIESDSNVIVSDNSILDGDSKVLKYSVTDGIHATNDYRSSVIWKVKVTNNSIKYFDGTPEFDASKLIEKIDNPFKLYGYTLVLKDENNNLIGSYYCKYENKEPDTTQEEYISKVSGENVTRNIYNIDLILDLEKIDVSSVTGTKEEIIKALQYFKAGYTYDLYLYTDMTEESLDWYYDTTILKLDNLIKFKFEEEQSIESNVGIKNDDWVSVIATNGIKYIEKYNNEKNVNSENGSVYLANPEEKVLKFTLEVGSYLYQTQKYTDGTIDNIIMYDLLPGLTEGGINSTEVGGGYTVDSNSFGAYILKTDGSKEIITPEHYKVMYSLDSLHTIRHPDSITTANDSVYNVDFSKASDESIWQEEYMKECRAFRVVFDETIKLKNADRLYVDYNVNASDDALESVNYNNIFGYIYNCTSTGGGIGKPVRLYADTGAITVKLNQPQELTFKKVLYDYDENYMVEGDIEEYFNKEFTFNIYKINYLTSYRNYSAKIVATFKLKPNQSITISEIEELTGVKFEVDKYYQLVESSNSYVSSKNIEIMSEQKYDDIAYIYSSYCFNFKYTDKKEPMLITFNNKITTRGYLRISKVDENNKGITLQDTSVSYQIFDENDNLLRFNNRYCDYYYNKYGDITTIDSKYSTIYLYNLPISKYYIKEVKAPNNYELSEEKIEVEFTEPGSIYKNIVNVKKDTPVNLTINKIDSSSKELITTGETSFNLRESYSKTSDIYKVVDLNKTDEKGRHYRLATEEDQETTEVLRTYNSKIYLENIGETEFYVHEIDAAFGYQQSSYNYWSYRYYSTVTEPVLNCSNSKNTKDITIFKKDINETKLLNNAKFEVLFNNEKMKFVKVEDEKIKYGSNYEGMSATYKMVPPNYTGEDAVTEISSESGIFTIKDIPNYIDGKSTNNLLYLKEITAPEGYELQEELQVINTTSDYIYINDVGKYSNIKLIDNKPDNGFIQITKKDDKNNVITEPITFEVYNENNEKMYFTLKETLVDKGNIYDYSKTLENAISEISTNDGKMFINSLPLGKYKIKETKFPDGFTTETEYTEFTIDYNNTETKPLSLDIINVHNTGKIVFTKVDTKGETILEQATFNIVNANNETLLFKQEENGTYVIAEDGSAEINTKEGKIEISNLPLGKYKLVETVAPDTFRIGEPTEFEIKGKDYYEAVQVNVVNKHAYGNVNLSKLNVNGELIESNEIVFRIYDENNNIVKFNEKETEEKTYEYCTDGSYSRITASKGKISIEKLPVGKYSLEELVAPNGYTLLADKVEFEVTDNEFTAPLELGIVNPDYIFGSEQYVSSSFEKIEEKDNNTNLGYGYFGKESDYVLGNRNYIYVDAKEDIVRYTLRIGNMSKKNFENLVVINKLPDIEDTGVINLDKNRGSEFTVKIANVPNYDIYMLDADGERIEIPDYTIEYTDEVKYTEADWDGQANEKWYSEPKDTTKSFRIKFSEGFILPSKYSIGFEFDGDIQDNAKPGLIAWNSFGYRYYVEGVKLSPEPPKVGVKIPYEPKLTKLVENDVEGEFEFEIYEKDEDEKLTLIKTLVVKSGETVDLEFKKIVNGIETGYLEAGKDYIIKEKSTKQFKQVHVEGAFGKAVALTDGEAFEFKYDMDFATDVTFTNTERCIGKVILTKTDVQTGEKLSSAEFELRDNNGNVLNLQKNEEEYVYSREANENTVTKAYTNDSGTLTIMGLPYGDYILYETKQPAGYLYGTENEYNFKISDETIEINSENKYVAKDININVYNTPTFFQIQKYFNENIRGMEYSGFVKGSLLQIWDGNKEKMYSEFTTDGSGNIDISKLEVGKYILVEETAPSGFAKAKDIHFEITNDGKVLIDDEEITDKTIKMQDEAILGDIIINKKGEVLNDIGILQIIGGWIKHIFSWIVGNLADVSFEIYASEDIYIQDMLVFSKDQLIDTITTNKLGVAKLENIPLGSYYAVEVKTKEEYEIEKTPISLKLDYKGTEGKKVICEETIVNERKQANITIHKTDDSNKPVEGAVFGLFVNSKKGIFKKDELLLIAITDKDGNANFGNTLPLGKYYIKELKAPENYIKSDEIKEFEFSETESFKFEFVNKKKPNTEQTEPGVNVSQNNTQTTIINNIINTQTNSSIQNKGEKTPNTGDMLPQIVIAIMSLVILSNIIIKKSNKKHK